MAVRRAVGSWICINIIRLDYLTSRIAIPCCFILCHTNLGLVIPQTSLFLCWAISTWLQSLWDLTSRTCWGLSSASCICVFCFDVRSWNCRCLSESKWAWDFLRAQVQLRSITCITEYFYSRVLFGGRRPRGARFLHFTHYPRAWKERSVGFFFFGIALPVGFKRMHRQITPNFSCSL